MSLLSQWNCFMMKNIPALLMLWTTRGLSNHTRNVTVLMEGCLVPWIACTPLKKIEQRDGRQQFKSGKEKYWPTVVLEALSDYHQLFCWHASFDYAGSQNDLNIQNLSPLATGFVGWQYIHNIGAEQQACPIWSCWQLLSLSICTCWRNLVPTPAFTICQRQHPTTANQCQSFFAWHEASRKDIERFYGVLRSCSRVMARPFLGHY